MQKTEARAHDTEEKNCGALVPDADAWSIAAKKRNWATRSVTTVSILLVDDYAVVRRGLRVLLEAEPGWKVVGEATNHLEAVTQCEQLRPDVVIMDVNTPALNGLEAAGLIFKAVPGTRVLVLAAHHTQEIIARALSSGVRGYVLKSEAESDLVAAVKILMQGRTFFSAAASEALKHVRCTGVKRERSSLTVREIEIVQLLAKGKSNKEVAAILGISPRTVENHRAQIMQMLGLRSFSELIRYAIRNGMVEL
ncbi:MAG TPA: response regulator transcription factor [Candidatus Angelobacter sp.]